MSSSRVLAAAAAASIGLAVMLGASAAVAATLPPGQNLLVVDDQTAEVYSASPSTAALTSEGYSIDPVDLPVSAIEVGDAGQGFALVTSQPDAGPSYLVPVDAVAGSAGSPVALTVEGGPALACSALTLRDGEYYTSCFSGTGDDRTTRIGTVDPTTGELDVLLTIDEELLLTAFAWDAGTSQFWAFEFRPDDGFAGTWLIDAEDWSISPGRQLDYPVWAADFDRDGQLFVSTTVPVGQFTYPELSVLDPSSGVFDLVAPFSVAGLPLDGSEQPQLTVWGAVPPGSSQPDPTLPPTGGDVFPVGLGAVLLLLAGAAFIAARRIERRA